MGIHAEQPSAKMDTDRVGPSLSVSVEPADKPIDQVDTKRATAQELIACARRRGIDLTPLWNDAAFLGEQRWIFFWRKVDSIPSSGPAHMKQGTICYNMQGAIKVVPSVLKDWTGAFRGGWTESGTFENLEQAVELVKAWLLDREEVDDLPQRCVRRYQLVPAGDQ
jgi:hypothetical protein